MLAPRRFRATTRAPFAPLLIAAALALGACGSDDDDDAATDAPTGSDASGQTSMPAPGVGPDDEIDTSAIAYVIPLTVEEEIPAPTGVPAGASGEASLVFDPETRGLTGTVTTSGLSGPPTMAHVHEQPAGEMTGPPIVTFLEDGTGTGFELPGDTILTEDQAESLETELLYVNVHTAQNREGEIRGQIVEQDPQEDTES